MTRLTTQSRTPGLIKRKTTVRYPYLYLIDVINRAVEVNYGESASKHVRLVRLRKEIKAGTLDHIDYAVPCFELAKAINSSPQAVSIVLYKFLKDTVDANFKFDHSMGYLNIQLSDQFLRQAIRSAQKLIIRGLASRLVSGQHKNRINIIAYSGTRTMDADSSQIAEYCAQTVEWIASSAQMRSSIYMTEYLNKTLISEKKVHHYINQLKKVRSSDEKELVLADDTTLAAYISLDEYSVGLRTSKGNILPHSHFVYLFNTLHKRTKKIKYSFDLILAPQEDHEYIHQLGKVLSWDFSKIALFDPKTSKADILELKKAYKSPRLIASDIEEFLLSTNKSTPSSDIRKEILLLVDYPIEVVTRLQESNFPMTFDLTNQAADTLRTLKK